MNLSRHYGSSLAVREPSALTPQQQQLLHDLEDQEFRESYGEQHTSWIGPQIRVLRELRGFSQAQLAEATNTQQSAISRMESPDYGKWSLPKLQQIAKLFGCWVEIKFRSYGKLVQNLHEHTRLDLQEPAFADDPVFHPGLPPLPDAPDEQVRGAQNEIRRWLLARTGALDADLRQWKRWLAGWDIPGIPEDEDPAPLFAAALCSGSWGFRSYPAVQATLKTLLQDCLHDPDAHSYLPGLLLVCAAAPAPRDFEPLLENIRRSLAARPADPNLTAPLVQAMMANQAGYTFLPIWKDAISGKPQHLSVSLEDALAGVSSMPPVQSDFLAAHFVAWTADCIFQRYEEARKSGAQNCHEEFQSLLVRFYRSLDSFRQRAILPVMLLVELTCVRVWNRFQEAAFAKAFLSAEPGRIALNDLLLEAAGIGRLLILTGQASRYPKYFPAAGQAQGETVLSNITLSELARLADAVAQRPGSFSPVEKRQSWIQERTNALTALVA